MQFSHHPSVWQRFPQLVAGVAWLDAVDSLRDEAPAAAGHVAIARRRLADSAGTESAEGAWPEIQAWRRAYAQMGHKPTQVRCAAEALLRRLRKEGGLPRLHPMIDLCNALSVRYAVPVAAFDTGQVAWPLEVRPASGAEDYLTFSGDIERPDAGEIVFADAEGHAHARRWAHRQSSRSALQAGTRSVLVVAEALHENAAASIDALMTQLEHDLRGSSVSVVAQAVLTARQPVFAPRGR